MPAALGLLILLVVCVWLFVALRACRAGLNAEPALIATDSSAQAEAGAEVSKGVDPGLLGFDADTFLPNRRYFDHQIKAEWSRCARSQRPISLLMARIDHVDQDSGKASEQTRTIAYALDTEARRGADLIFRYDERSFAVVLAETGHEDAAGIARRMQSHVRTLDLVASVAGVASGQTLSIAVISASNEDRSVSRRDWLGEADNALQLLTQGKSERFISRAL